MKIKLLSIILISALCLMCTACGSKSDADGQTADAVVNETVTQNPSSSETSSITPTGYPDGELQNIYVMYGNRVYVYDDNGRRTIDEAKIPDSYSGYEKAGEVTRIDNINLPTKDFTASRIETGASIYADKKNADNILLYYDGQIYTMIPNTEGDNGK